MDEEKAKKDVKVRTSITIDPNVLEAVRKVCDAEKISVSSFIEKAVEARLDEGLSNEI